MPLVPKVMHASTISVELECSQMDSTVSENDYDLSDVVVQAAARASLGQDNDVAHFTNATRFQTSDSVYRLLFNVDVTQVLPEVPRGPKASTFFVVDNSANVTRKENKQPNRFWDDCGEWDSKQGRNNCATFVKTADSMMGVIFHGGAYCVKKRLQKKVFLEPLNPQPDAMKLIAIHSYYANLKSDGNYRNRVSYLRSQPQAALVEYLDVPARVNPPHGLARMHGTEYVRTQPKVMDSMRWRWSTESQLGRFTRSTSRYRSRSRHLETTKKCATWRSRLDRRLLIDQ